MVQDMMESILKSLSMRSFIEDCQEHLCKIFKCQRANMILVDRPRRKLFRVKFGEQTHYREKYVLTKTGKIKTEMEPYISENDFMESFPIEETDYVKTGLAGYVAKGYFSLLSEKVEDDNRFLPYVDDPQSLEGNVEPAR